MQDKPIVVSEVTEGFTDIAKKAVDTLGQEPANIGKTTASQTGITPPSQQNQAQDQKIKDIEAKDRVETEEKLEKDRKELEEIKMKHHKEQVPWVFDLEQPPQQPAQPQPTGPEVLPSKKLEPYTPLIPGKASKPGETIDLKQKKGTREKKLGIAA